LLPEEKTVLVIPATAVLSQPYGDSVYVIEPAPENHRSETRIGRAPANCQNRRGARRSHHHQDWSKAGERVVSAGGLKLRNGMSVTENNDLVPKSEKSLIHRKHR